MFEFISGVVGRLINRQDFVSGKKAIPARCILRFDFQSSHTR